eukprot:6168450-Prymnesium_polylepis.1
MRSRGSSVAREEVGGRSRGSMRTLPAIERRRSGCASKMVERVVSSTSSRPRSSGSAWLSCSGERRTHAVRARQR